MLREAEKLQIGKRYNSVLREEFFDRLKEYGVFKKRSAFNWIKPHDFETNPDDLSIGLSFEAYFTPTMPKSFYPYLKSRIESLNPYNEATDRGNKMLYNLVESSMAIQGIQFDIYYRQILRFKDKISFNKFLMELKERSFKGGTNEDVWTSDFEPMKYISIRHANELMTKYESECSYESELQITIPMWMVEQSKSNEFRLVELDERSGKVQCIRTDREVFDGLSHKVYRNTTPVKTWHYGYGKQDVRSLNQQAKQ